MSKVKKKTKKVRPPKEKYWPMRVGGPYSEKDGDANEIFKCTDCGAETETAAGWNGAPNKHQCRPGCACAMSDWTPGRGYSPRGRKNYDRIFPNAPGAGL